ncbi:protease SohB [Thiohalocapsa halophila]|uniref:Protease SohB n=1 Tax=Thiohalocapsa halophila TaxID=69359 RepID=A0ABS1CBJ7_9GAMM|nr:protease SohB [Thiohalocapsa halophila]MBK1629303.1 protease SohB [Thiohalocapsa halophila]
MLDALIDYGLFTAKTLTLLALLGVFVALALRARHQGGHEVDGGRLEITNLNDRYEDMADGLKRATLPPKAYKRWAKAEQKAHKARAKAETAERPRLFVLDFHGDLLASEVGGLRETVSALLQEAGEGDEVLVRLDNAGGAVHEHGLGASQLLRIRRRGIALTVAVDRVAASGGYLMACVADRIVAAPFAIIGSIGVIAQLPNFHRWLQHQGIDFELHTAGDYKRTLTLFGENTEAGRAKLREHLEETHQLFKGFIREYRKDLDLDKVATGEYWYGEQALGLGLVDDLSTSDDYLLAARASRDLYRLRWQSKKRPWQRLASGMRALLTRLPAAFAGSPARD